MDAKRDIRISGSGTCTKVSFSISLSPFVPSYLCLSPYLSLCIRTLSSLSCKIHCGRRPTTWSFVRRNSRLLPPPPTTTAITSCPKGLFPTKTFSGSLRSLIRSNRTHSPHPELAAVRNRIITLSRDSQDVITRFILGGGGRGWGNSGERDGLCKTTGNPFPRREITLSGPPTNFFALIARFQPICHRHDCERLQRRVFGITLRFPVPGRNWDSKIAAPLRRWEIVLSWERGNFKRPSFPKKIRKNDVGVRRGGRGGRVQILKMVKKKN